MRATKLKKLAISIPLALCASHAGAKSILVTGSLETVSPKVSFPAATEQQAFVNPFQLLAKEAANSGCRITGDPNVAMADHGEDLVCLYEWTKLPQGMNAAGLSADGYLEYVGENEFKYEISYFSGKKLEKVKISEGSHIINAIQPALPDYLGVTTNLSHGTYEGLDVTSYNKSSGVQSITITADTRPYKQIASMSGLGSCVVEPNESSCDIDTNSRSVVTNGEITGQNEHLLTIDSANGYFKKNGRVLPEKYNLAWDFRTPTPTALRMQALSQENSDSKAYEIEGVSFIVENEQAKLIVDTPHFGKAGSWWVPSAKIELSPDPSFKPEIPVFNVNGVDVIETNEMVSQPQETFLLHALGAPEVSNGKYIFTFNLAQVADGKFIPKVSLNDAYDNKMSQTFDPVTLDRQPPDVQLFYSGKRFLDEGVVYFFENMAVVALDTFDGGAEILSVKVNGTDLTMEGESPYLKKLKGAELALTPQREYPFEVKVKDNAGNIFTKAMTVRYMPMDYKLKDSELEYYKKVQRIDLDVMQTQGISCALYGNEAELSDRSFNYGESHRCYLEWTSLPNGTNGYYVRGQHSLIGSFASSSDETPNTVSYRVWMVDSNGNKALAAEEVETLKVSLAPAPSLTVTQKNTIRENIYPVDLTGSRFATAIAKGINADLELSVDDGAEESILVASQRKGYFSQTSAYKTLQVNAGKLWDTKKFTVTAKYALASEINSTTELETFYIPSRRIRSRIMTEELSTLDTLAPVVNMKIGIYDSSEKDFVYNKEEMGEWVVYLAVTHRDRESRETIYTPITEKKKFVPGKTQFELDVSNVGYGSYRFVAVADLVSPVDGYERRILSNNAFYRVLKGGKLDGDIKSYRLASKIPFSASVAYEPETSADRRSMGDIVWEISANGTDNWKPIPEFANKTRLRQVIDVAGHYYVRARVKNKYSGAEIITEQLEFLGYEVPDLRTQGPSALYEGETSVIKLIDHDDFALVDSGTIEWSYDGETWEEGGNSLEVIGTGERMQIWVRMAYHDNELAGKDRFDIVRHRIAVKKPQPLRISIQAPRIVEVGESFTLEPIVRLATTQLESEVVKEWVLPDGTVVSGDSITYTPTVFDADKGNAHIQFRTWVKQLKDDTYAVKDLAIRTWQYEFPDFRFDVNYRTKYAPITAHAVVRKLDHLPAPVEFTYDFQMFEGMEKDRESGDRLYFTASEPGIHQMRVVISDDRGNQQTMVELIEVVPPPKTTIELNGTYSTAYMRYPLDASIRSRVILGHPSDQIDKYEWYLDGELLTEQTGYRANIDNLSEGSHIVKLKVTSKFGLVEEQLLSIDVVPNIKPTCSINYRQYAQTIKVQSGCMDADGKIATHNWYVDGEIKHVHANNMSFPAKSGIPVTVRVTGYDDSGDTADATITITPE
ncbi:MAG: Ig-like domain-containing protein [Pseudoalteromonas distincta]